MEGVDLQASDVVLKQDGTETEVGVRMDAGVLVRLYRLEGDGHVVQKSELRIGPFHIGVEESR